MFAHIVTLSRRKSLIFELALEETLSDPQPEERSDRRTQGLSPSRLAQHTYLFTLLNMT